MGNSGYDDFSDEELNFESDLDSDEDLFYDDSVEDIEPPNSDKSNLVIGNFEVTRPLIYTAAGIFVTLLVVLAISVFTGKDTETALVESDLTTSSSLVNVDQALAPESMDSLETTSTSAKKSTTTVKQTTTTKPPKKQAKVNLNLSVSADNKIILVGDLTDCDYYNNVSLKYDYQGSSASLPLDCGIGAVSIYEEIADFNSDQGANVAVNLSSSGKTLFSNTLNLTPEAKVDDPSAIPANSGEGRRIIYDRRNPETPGVFKVWLVDIVDGKEQQVHFYKVRGNSAEPAPGQYNVYNRSEVAYSTRIEESSPPKYKYHMKYMVRFIRPNQQGNELAIGFHGIPCNPDDPNECLAGPQDAGEFQSAGCARQSDQDAKILWDFAGKDFPSIDPYHTSHGTKVVVLG